MDDAEWRETEMKAGIGATAFAGKSQAEVVGRWLIFGPEAEMSTALNYFILISLFQLRTMSAVPLVVTLYRTRLSNNEETSARAIQAL